nr:MAG TPA: hypothetical protein [Caudoviricetes sp.]DAN60841.1 MAG TPA: hypothetical protein [Caudoviricetes sp.]
MIYFMLFTQRSKSYFKGDRVRLVLALRWGGLAELSLVPHSCEPRSYSQNSSKQCFTTVTGFICNEGTSYMFIPCSLQILSVSRLKMLHQIEK